MKCPSVLTAALCDPPPGPGVASSPWFHGEDRPSFSQHPCPPNVHGTRRKMRITQDPVQTMEETDSQTDADPQIPRTTPGGLLLAERFPRHKRAPHVSGAGTA